MIERTTTEARAALQRMALLAASEGRREMTPQDLAAALAGSPGNTVGLWPPAQADAGASAATGVAFDRAAKLVMEQAFHVAAQERAGHVGTEHLLAALVRTGPPEVVAWLDARGATTDAVDALLAGLAGGPGVERLTAEPSRADERRWRRATAHARGETRMLPALIVPVLLLTTAIVVFACCLWGP
ncbi:hypothetical protein [Dactylosporangium sp. NPDC006015]|uniref:hypothetical protein n=1 Tax=Dactylosporangium sp. NPDC006015 TaxID=3154576 RepID=UPI0033A4917F